MQSIDRTCTPARHFRGVLRAAMTMVVAALMALSLTACGEGEASDVAASSSNAASTAGVSFEDGWAKAADSGMSAAFGDLVNNTDQDITLVSVSSPAASEVQLHETVSQPDGSMSMQEKAGGFIVPAGSHHHFEPGADHLMLMGITGPIQAGDTVPFTFTFADGSTLEVTLVAKDFQGGEEAYHSHESGSSGDMGDMGSNDGS